jgi:hypothetical protein
MVLIELVNVVDTVELLMVKRVSKSLAEKRVPYGAEAMKDGED